MQKDANLNYSVVSTTLLIGFNIKFYLRKAARN